MKNPIISMALYTVSSNVDSITASPDIDGQILITIVDDNYEECHLRGDAWMLEEWVKEYNFDLRIDILEINLDTKSVINWS